MTFLAPCGHPGVPIIGTYVSCLSCDGKPKKVELPAGALLVCLYDGLVPTTCETICMTPWILQYTARLVLGTTGTSFIVPAPGVYTVERDGTPSFWRVWVKGNVLMQDTYAWMDVMCGQRFSNIGLPHIKVSVS